MFNGKVTILAFILISILISGISIPTQGTPIHEGAHCVQIDDTIGGPVKYTVPGVIPAYKQPKTNLCWVTAAAIMISWKKQKAVTIAESADMAGVKYRLLFDNNKGLSGSEKSDFLNGINLRAEAPQNYTVDGWLALLKKFGPIWVTSNEGTTQMFSAHAQVVKGIEGDGSLEATFFTIVDPYYGQETTESVAEFQRKFEEVAKKDLGEHGDLRPQVIHH